MAAMDQLRGGALNSWINNGMKSSQVFEGVGAVGGAPGAVPTTQTLTPQQMIERATASMREMQGGAGGPGHFTAAEPPPGAAAQSADNIASRMGQGARSTVDDIVRGMGQSGRTASAGAAETVAKAAPTFMEDLGTLGGAAKSVAGAVASPFVRGAEAVMANPVAGAGVRVLGKAALPIGAAIGGYQAGSELLDANSAPRQRFSAAGDAAATGNYGGAAKNAYYGVGDVVGTATGLKPLVQGIAGMFAPPAAKAAEPMTYDPVKQEFSRAPQNMEDYRRQQELLQQGRDAVSLRPEQLRPGERAAMVVPEGTKMPTAQETANIRKELGIPDSTQRAGAGQGAAPNASGVPQDAAQAVLRDIQARPQYYLQNMGARGVSELLTAASGAQNASSMDYYRHTAKPIPVPQQVQAQMYKNTQDMARAEATLNDPRQPAEARNVAASILKRLQAENARNEQILRHSAPMDLEIMMRQAQERQAAGEAF